MQSFMTRLMVAIDGLSDELDRKEIQVAVVGSGVAGIEITCCIPSILAEKTGREVSMRLVTRSQTILPAMETKAQDLVSRELDRRRVQVVTGRSVNRVVNDQLMFDNGESVDADIAIWATNASAPSAISGFGLEVDDRGFIATDRTLKTSSKSIFAVGDSGTIIEEGLPKAGVYAVRQGPVLWENIQRTLNGQTLENYVPQRSFLKLINLGDGRAVGQWKSLAFSGRLAMRLKEWIDGRFMDKFQTGAEMNESMAVEEMQCRGCGCKLGADVLESALSDSDEELDDAAEIGGDCDFPLLASTDFFSSPFDDHFLSGRVAALHSASDIVASGALATEALANVVLPEGDRNSQKRALQDFLAGARLEFDAMGASVVGGHTIVGPRMEVGFTVIGKPLGKSLLRQGQSAGRRSALCDQADWDWCLIGRTYAQPLSGICLRIFDRCDAVSATCTRQHCIGSWDRRGHGYHGVWTGWPFDRNAQRERTFCDNRTPNAAIPAGSHRLGSAGNRK